jgi:murein DD-endopeptidase MepM/ murein hydrolase activator NlpD
MDQGGPAFKAFMAPVLHFVCRGEAWSRGGDIRNEREPSSLGGTGGVSAGNHDDRMLVEIGASSYARAARFDARGSRRCADHRADGPGPSIPAPRGTPVRAVDDGVVQKLFTNVPGGLTIYEFDRYGAYCYYYAHLDRYAEGLKEGTAVKKGDVIGYVGTTGNVPPSTPHLHFTIFKLGPEKQWWKGTAVNPYPLWALKKINSNG